MNLSYIFPELPHPLDTPSVYVIKSAKTVISIITHKGITRVVCTLRDTMK